MSNFDAKFGPRPVHVADELRILGAQFLVVVVLAYAVGPSFLQAPNTESASVALVTLFALMTVAATVAVHRSFIVSE